MTIILQLFPFSKHTLLLCWTISLWMAKQNLTVLHFPLNGLADHFGNFAYTLHFLSRTFLTSATSISLYFLINIFVFCVPRFPKEYFEQPVHPFFFSHKILLQINNFSVPISHWVKILFLLYTYRIVYWYFLHVCGERESSSKWSSKTSLPNFYCLLLHGCPTSQIHLSWTPQTNDIRYFFKEINIQDSSKG